MWFRSPENFALTAWSPLPRAAAAVHAALVVGAVASLLPMPAPQPFSWPRPADGAVQVSAGRAASPSGRAALLPPVTGGQAAPGVHADWDRRRRLS